MAPMAVGSATAERSGGRWWSTFLAGGAIGLVLLLLTQVLSDSRIAFGPWALNGNGALAVPFVGFPLAIYAGWTYLADRHARRDLWVHLASYSTGLILGAGVFGLFFGLPMVLVTAAIYATWTRGASVRKSDRLLWLAFAVSVVPATLVPVFGVGLLPASLILLARGKTPRTRIALGALLVAVSIAITFGLPVALLRSTG
jgi:hypothetical protein